MASGGKTGGRRNGIMGNSARGPLLMVGDGGGDRRGGMAGVVSGLGGTALRTISFSGSIMDELDCP
jgi:hypothetical protein